MVLLKILGSRLFKCISVVLVVWFFYFAVAVYFLTSFLMNDQFFDKETTDPWSAFLGKPREDFPMVLTIPFFS